MYILYFDLSSSEEETFKEHFLERCLFVIHTQVTVNDKYKSLFIIKTDHSWLEDVFEDEQFYKLNTLEEHLFLTSYLATEWILLEQLDGVQGGVFSRVQEALTNTNEAEHPSLRQAMYPDVINKLVKDIPFKVTDKLSNDAFECLFNSVGNSINNRDGFYEQKEYAYLLLRQQQQKVILDILELNGLLKNK